MLSGVGKTEEACSDRAAVLLENPNCSPLSRKLSPEDYLEFLVVGTTCGRPRGSRPSPLSGLERRPANQVS